MAKSMKPGAGGAFAKLKGELAKKPGIKNPGAIAAKVGREKYGNEQMAEMAGRGRSRAAAERQGKPVSPLHKVHELSKGDGLEGALKKAAQFKPKA